MLTGKSDKLNMKSLSSDEQLKLRRLAIERISGRFEDDADGFARELIRVSQSISKRQSSQEKQIIVDHVKGESNSELGSLISDLYEDRERFRDEIAKQLRRKITEHTYSKKLEDSDLVKPKINEAYAYAEKARINDERISELEGQAS